MRTGLLLIVTIALLSLVTYTIYLMEHEPRVRKLSGIDVVMIGDSLEHPFMDATDIRREMDKKGLNYIGYPIDSIDVGRIEKVLKANPLFRDVEIYIVAPTGRMKVEIRQQDASFWVYSSAGHYYVSTDRAVIPQNTQYAIYVPIVTGEFTEDYARGELFDLLQTIRSDTYFKHYFGHIHVDKEEGIILTPRVGQTSVILGHSTEWKRMLHKYRVFIEHVYPRVGDCTYEYVKLAYGSQVVTKVKGWKGDIDTLIQNKN